jgi:hypothetical protein
MKFGVHFQIPCGPGQAPADRYRDTIDQAVYAETLGHESVWPVEQHFSPASSIVPSPLILLTAIAARDFGAALGQWGQTALTGERFSNGVCGCPLGGTGCVRCCTLDVNSA